MTLGARIAGAALLSLPASAVAESGQSPFTIQSGDGANSVRLRALLHVDGRHFEGDVRPDASSTWRLRRVRPTIEGTVAGVYDFRFTTDFAGGRTVVQDAYVTARFSPWAAVTVGKFKVPVGLERIQSANDTRFAERAFPSSLVPNRDIGVQLAGELADGSFSYAISHTYGVIDGGSSDASGAIDNDAEGDVSARLFLQPFLNSDRIALRGLGFGVGGTYVHSTGSPTHTLLAQYRTPGQATFFRYRGNTAVPDSDAADIGNATFADGKRLRLAPQFHYYAGNFGVLGEYTMVVQDVTRVNGGAARSASLTNKAWQVQLSWLLTGEDESFKGVTPERNFGIDRRGRGAWELVVRMHELRIDGDAFAGGESSFADPASAARRARSAGIGVNWYLSRYVRWSAGYELTRFNGGAATGDRPDEKLYVTRIGLAF